MSHKKIWLKYCTMLYIPKGQHIKKYIYKNKNKHKYLDKKPTYLTKKVDQI